MVACHDLTLTIIRAEHFGQRGVVLGELLRLVHLQRWQPIGVHPVPFIISRRPTLSGLPRVGLILENESADAITTGSISDVWRRFGV